MSNEQTVPAQAGQVKRRVRPLGVKPRKLLEWLRLAEVADSSRGGKL